MHDETAAGLDYAGGMMDLDTRQALVAWLDWQLAMGADAAVDAAATDWLDRGPVAPGQHLSFVESAPQQESAAPAPPGPPASLPGSGPLASPATSPASPQTGRQPTSQPQAAAPPPRPLARPPIAPTPAPASRQFPTAAPDAAEASARRQARGAGDLAELHNLLAQFDGCALKATAKSLCFYRGSAKAPLMLIGEAPGREEDLEGRPFVGPAGRLLDRMLAAAGLSEAQVHITNVVYWRPPGNRTPTPQEVQVCRPFLERQIELVAPRLIVPMGGAAAKAVLDIAEGIMKVRGRWQDIEIAAHRARAMATLHPAFLLRTPAAKRLAWRDILAIKMAMEDADSTEK